MLIRRTAPFWVGLLVLMLCACGSSTVPDVGGTGGTSGGTSGGTTGSTTGGSTDGGTSGGVGGGPDVGSTTYNPCNTGDFPWQGGYAALATSFSSVQLDPSTPDYNQAVVPASFDGTLLRPSDTQTYPGKRPVVIIEHGEAGDQCNMWWLAHALSGAGYVTLLVQQPKISPASTEGTSIVAMVSALQFIESPDNPYSYYIDTSRIGLSGHSEGATSAAYVQGLPLASSVRAIVAFDNLKHYVQGDTGSALIECIAPKKYPVTPTVPALGFAQDMSCVAKLAANGPDIKESGWSWWLQSAQPSIELVMKGFSHLTFTDTIVVGGNSQQLQTLATYTQAWFDRWIQGDTSADQTLLSCTVVNQNTVDVLSTKYLSGAYLPSQGTQTSDFRTLLQQTCP